jgi:hypothetical protein
VTIEIAANQVARRTILAPTRWHRDKVGIETKEVAMRSIANSLLAATAVMLTAGAASAAVVCNEDGDCWRVKGKPAYGEELRLRIHPDEWTWPPGERYRWLEPGMGHGYYRSGVWVRILD